MKFYLFIFSMVFISSCIKPPADRSPDDWIFSVEGMPVSRDEFIYNLKKNNFDHDSTISEEEIREYLGLYINFKLKVYEARQLGFDTSAAYKKEYKKYLDQLTDSYMKDDSIIDDLVHEAYDHMLTEVKAAHILVRIENQANPADTFRAYQKINQIRDLAIGGRDFNQLAVEFSEDPSAVTNKGELGYFTGLQMVYPFEKVAYSTPIGEISKPFKTRFGYHLLKVEDIRPAQGKVEVAHIMLGTSKNKDEEDSLAVVEKIYAIHDSLISGGDWVYFCKKYSEDINSRDAGGQLRPFETGRIYPSFSEAAFALNEPGEISQPVQTPYGWHIIRLIRKYPITSFEDMKDDLTSRVKQDSRSEISHSLLIAKLRKENRYRVNYPVRDNVLAMADSTLLEAQWRFDPEDTMIDSTLFSIGDQDFPVADFFEYVEQKQKPVNNTAPSIYFNQLFNDFANEKIIGYQKDRLGDKYFEYRMLSREYAEGILLFDIMDKKVWSHAVQDSAGLDRYYLANIDQYQWGPRLEAVIFRSPEVQVIDEVRELLDEPYYPIDNNPVPLYSDPGKLKNSLDSLYGILEKDSAWYLELSVPIDNDRLKFISFLNSNGFDTSKIILKPVPVDQYASGHASLRVVSTAKKDIDKLISDKWGVNLYIESGFFQMGENDIVDQIDWNEGIHDLSIENDEYIVYVEKILPPMAQNLNEIQGKVVSDYQHFLEQQWISELKAKYDVKINQPLLRDIIQEFEKP